MIFGALDFISKLAALVPVPRVNLTRFHGVFAPHSQYRAQIINRESDNKTLAADVRGEGERRAAMKWAERLKRAFKIDINICEACGGAVKVIACIEDPLVINKILTHLNHQAYPNNQFLLPVNRAPPAHSWPSRPG